MNLLDSSTPKRKKEIKYDETEENTFSFWWDSQDIIDFNHTNPYPISSRFKTSVDISIWKPYEFEIKHIIDIFNTRSLLHMANIISFENTRKLLDNYITMSLNKFMTLHINLMSDLKEMKNNLKTFNGRIIFGPIFQIIKKLYTARQNRQLFQLIKFRKFIIDLENYLTYQGKCLLDILYQIKFMSESLNFRGSAIFQSQIPSVYNKYLEEKIFEYKIQTNEIYNEMLELNKSFCLIN